MSLCREADSAEAVPVKVTIALPLKYERQMQKSRQKFCSMGRARDKRGKALQKCCLYLPLTLLEAH